MKKYVLLFKLPPCCTIFVSVPGTNFINKNTITNIIMLRTIYVE